jgi:hypothetical protein
MSLSLCFGARTTRGCRDRAVGVEAEREMVVQGAGWGRRSEDGWGREWSNLGHGVAAHCTHLCSEGADPMKAKDDRHL